MLYHVTSEQNVISILSRGFYLPTLVSKHVLYILIEGKKFWLTKMNNFPTISQFYKPIVFYFWYKGFKKWLRNMWIYIMGKLLGKRSVFKIGRVQDYLIHIVYVCNTCDNYYQYHLSQIEREIGVERRDSGNLGNGIYFSSSLEWVSFFSLNTFKIAASTSVPLWSEFHSSL